METLKKSVEQALIADYYPPSPECEDYEDSPPVLKKVSPPRVNGATKYKLYKATFCRCN